MLEVLKNFITEAERLSRQKLIKVRVDYKITKYGFSPRTRKV